MPFDLRAHPNGGIPLLPIVEGAAALLLGDVAVAGAAEVSSAADGALVLGAVDVDAAGAASSAADGALVLGPVVVAGTGTLLTEGVGDVVLGPVVGTGAGSASSSADGALVLGAVDVDAEAVIGSAGAVALGLGAVEVDAEAVVSSSAAGDLVLDSIGFQNVPPDDASIPRPRLMLARPSGRSAVRVVFNRPMKVSGSFDDPTAVTGWTGGGGLPAVVGVERLSNLEFLLRLASPAALDVDYTLTADHRFRGADDLQIRLVGRTQTVRFEFDDLRVDDVAWSTPTDLVVSLSAAPVGSPSAVVAPVDPDARDMRVLSTVIVGSELRVAVSVPGTAGARYALTLRDVRDENGTALLSADTERVVYGQGDAPSVSVVATEDTLTATSTDVLGAEGWPLAAGGYRTTPGTLGRNISRDQPAVLRFADSDLPLGQSVSFAPKTVSAVLDTSANLSAQASFMGGAGTSLVLSGRTVLGKTAGDPYEITFDNASRTGPAGRRLSVDLAFTFAPSSSVVPLLGITFLDRQISVLFTKTSGNLVQATLYRGNKQVGAASRPLAVDFSLEIVDATAEPAGFLAVLVDGAVVLGASRRDMNDSLLLDRSVSPLSIALTLGSPTAPSATFSVAVDSDIRVTSFLATGYLGRSTRDLLTFTAASGTVSAGSGVAPSGGYEGTGLAAFGAFAGYGGGIDAVQVIIGVNPSAPAEFTGSVTLLAADGSPVDQIAFSSEDVMEGPEREIAVIFLHPAETDGLRADVSVVVDGETYTSVVGVGVDGADGDSGVFASQPASWYHGALL